MKQLVNSMFSYGAYQKKKAFPEANAYSTLLICA